MNDILSECVLQGRSAAQGDGTSSLRLPSGKGSQYQGGLAASVSFSLVVHH